MSLWSAYDLPSDLKTNVPSFETSFNLQSSNQAENQDFNNQDSKEITTSRLEAFASKRGLDIRDVDEDEYDFKLKSTENDGNEWEPFEEDFDTVWNSFAKQRQNIPEKPVVEQDRTLPWLATFLERQKQKDQLNVQPQQPPKREKMTIQVGLDLRSQFSIGSLAGPWASIEGESDDELHQPDPADKYFVHKEIMHGIERTQQSFESLQLSDDEQPKSLGYVSLQDEA